MNKFLIKEIFKIHGGVGGLTEKVIYDNQAYNQEDNIYVFSGATEEKYHLPKVDKNLKINDRPIKVFSDKHDYILVARKGKAGVLKLISGVSFTINDDAYIMQLKKNFIKKVNLSHFINKYQKTFFDFVSSKDSNGTFSKEIAENYEVVIEPIEDIEHYYIAVQNKNNKIISSIKKHLEDIDNQLTKTVITNKLSKKFLISELFDITSGVRITQKEVYYNQGNIPIVTSQTSNEGIAWHGNKEWLSKFEKNTKKLIFTEPCITWTKEGNAGKMFFRDYAFFPIDVAGVLRLKTNVNINLHWFLAVFQNYIYMQTTSKGGQGKLYEEQMANIEVEIPVKENGEIDIEQQNIIYAEYKRLLDIKENLESIIKKYS